MTRTVLVVLAAAVLAGCGGGSGRAGTTSARRATTPSSRTVSTPGSIPPALRAQVFLQRVQSACLRARGGHPPRPRATRSLRADAGRALQQTQRIAAALRRAHAPTRALRATTGALAAGYERLLAAYAAVSAGSRPTVAQGMAVAGLETAATRAAFAAGLPACAAPRH